jgi:hypothetical protein
MVQFTRHHYDYYIREDEIGIACSTDELSNAFNILVGKPEGMKQLARLRRR